MRVITPHCPSAALSKAGSTQTESEGALLCRLLWPPASPEVSALLTLGSNVEWEAGGRCPAEQIVGIKEKKMVVNLRDCLSLKEILRWTLKVVFLSKNQQQKAMCIRKRMLWGGASPLPRTTTVPWTSPQLLLPPLLLGCVPGLTLPAGRTPRTSAVPTSTASTGTVSQCRRPFSYEWKFIVFYGDYCNCWDSLG